MLKQLRENLQKRLGVDLNLETYLRGEEKEEEKQEIGITKFIDSSYEVILLPIPSHSFPKLAKISFLYQPTQDLPFLKPRCSLPFPNTLSYSFVYIKF